MLNLNQSLYLSSGEKRDVYFHPEQNDKCIKIEKPAGIKSNAIEAHFFKRYRACRALPKFFGIDETSLGRGLVVELVKDFDGKISKSMKDYLTENVLDKKECLKYVSDVEKECLANSVLLHDDGLQNILLRRNHDQSYTPILIDGFGPRDLSRKTIFKVIFPFLAKQKSRQVFQKMNKKLL